MSPSFCIPHCGHKLHQHLDFQGSTDSKSSTNDENSSQPGTGTQSSTDTQSETGTNDSADASADSSSNDVMSMADKDKSSSSDNKDYLVPCMIVRSSLDVYDIADTTPPAVAAIIPASTHRSAPMLDGTGLGTAFDTTTPVAAIIPASTHMSAPMLDGTGLGTVPSPIIAPVTVSLDISGKMWETQNAGAAASHSSASTPVPSTLGQIGVTTTIASGPDLLDNNDLYAVGQDLPGQGTPFYFNCTFLNSFNNILDVHMNSPPPPN